MRRKLLFKNTGENYKNCTYSGYVTPSANVTGLKVSMVVKQYFVNNACIDNIWLYLDHYDQDRHKLFSNILLLETHQ